MERETILWRRLDQPGHEAAELSSVDDGWRLCGVAVFAEAGRPCRLEYDIACDRDWSTRRCSVAGLVGTTRVSLELERSARGDWSVNGSEVPSLDRCSDVDLGFSPATNLLPIRRLRLSVGAAAPVRAAWVRFPEMTVEVLEQEYRRVSVDRYHYESAGGAFQRELIVDDSGFVLHYPELWSSEARASERVASDRS
jgi:uncharacterized protein